MVALSVHVYMCACVCARACVRMCVYMWKPEVVTGNYPVTFHLIFCHNPPLSLTMTSPWLQRSGSSSNILLHVCNARRSSSPPLLLFFPSPSLRSPPLPKQPASTLRSFPNLDATFETLVLVWISWLYNPLCFPVLVSECMICFVVLCSSPWLSRRLWALDRPSPKHPQLI